VSLFAWPARVYWEDTDGGGIVYYANYLRFLERARTEWLRSLGHSQQVLASKAGILFTVVSLSVDYRRPAKLDDELIITCDPQVEGAASVRFAQRIYRGTGQPRAGVAACDVDESSGSQIPGKEHLLVEASVRVACIDARTLRPRRLPEFLSNAAQVLASDQGSCAATSEGALLNG
jgi:acyl-CoA thioester hydrolase